MTNAIINIHKKPKLTLVRIITEFLTVLFFMGTLSFSTGAFYFYENPRVITTIQVNENTIYFSNKSKRDIELEKIKQIGKQPKEISELESAAWIPDWDIPDGLQTVKNQPNAFTILSPVWFWVNEDGSLQFTSKSNWQEFINYSKNNNYELIPTITLFDADILNKILRSEENTQRHIDQIVSQVTENNYDGIDLDYESTYLKDRKLFLAFLKELSLELKARDKKLVFTVLPKWGDYTVYESLPQTRMAQDYKEISNIVDEFRIMTYEFTGRSADQAGPIAPLEWMEDTVKYAINVGVPREKIMLGVHTYAYDWAEREVTKSIKGLDGEYLLNTSGEKEPGAALFYTSIEKIRNSYVFNETFNELWGEAVGFYEFKGGNRVVVYMNDTGIELRKKLASNYGIKGIAIWRVGDEGSLKY